MDPHDILRHSRVREGSALFRPCPQWQTIGRRSRHAPGPAIVEEQNVPPRSPDGLCQVSAHLIPRQTVWENHRAVWTYAARNVEPRVQFHTVTQHDKLDEPRREFFIGRSICYDSRRCLLRPRMHRCPKIPSRATIIILCLNDFTQPPQSGKYRRLYRFQRPNLRCAAVCPRITVRPELSSSQSEKRRNRTCLPTIHPEPLA